MDKTTPIVTKTDTHPRIEEIMIEGYRRMTPQEKLKRVSQLSLTVQQLALARLKKQYPRATERELTLRLAALRIDREIMVRVFNWDPEVEGY